MNEIIAKLILPFAKTASKLNLSKVENISEVQTTQTYFGGQPYAESGDNYPFCPTCSKPLNFICQINTKQGFHEDSLKIGLITFFYCYECFPWGFENDEKGQWVVKVYKEPAAEKFVKMRIPEEIQYHTEPCLVEVEQIKVFPNWEEIDNLSAEISQEISEVESEREIWEEYDSTIKDLGGFTDFTTTVGGYPFWVQGAETSECNICKKQMKLLAQIDSEEKAGLCWGDSGLVYLFFCENHFDQIKLILQCF